MTFTLPAPDCPLCPRLQAFRNQNRGLYPAYCNVPVPSFGAIDASLLVVGLAPGLKGANQTGRPFTGDYAGMVLYSSLKKHGLAEGDYAPEQVKGGQGDGFTLKGVRITNAVRCVPPANKPEPAEIKTCNSFLAVEIRAMPRLRVILSLGLVSHKGVLMALGLKQAAYAFRHGAEYQITNHQSPITLFDSYHCSRYNINTGVLTQAMFDDVVEKVKKRIGGLS